MEELLRKKREQLASVQTVLSTKDGRKYIEQKDGSLVLLNEQSKLIEAAPDPQLAKIMDNLYLGSQDAAANITGLKENKVTHILNVATGIPAFYPSEFIYKNVEILDVPEAPINDYFGECFSFIEEAIKKGAVLVHCNAGVSRSATIVIAYVMKTKRISYQEAYSFVKQSRNQIKPNEGFVISLQKFEKQLL